MEHTQDIFDSLNVQRYHSPNYLVLDFETTKFPRALYRIPESRLVLACWKYKGRMKHCFGDEHHQAALLRDVQEAEFIVAHNWKFEAGWLKRMGIDLRTLLPWDTMTAEWILHAGKQAPKGFYTLDETAIRHGHVGKLDLVKLLWNAGLDTQDIPEKTLLSYCKRDIEATEHVFRRQLELLSKETTC